MSSSCPLGAKAPLSPACCLPGQPASYVMQCPYLEWVHLQRRCMNREPAHRIVGAHGSREDRAAESKEVTNNC